MQTHNGLSAQARSDRPGYGGIDVLRFLCAILIIMIHVVPLGSSQGRAVLLLNHALRNVLARAAVPFFFMCSGFFLYRKTPADRFSTEPTKKTVLRLGRLYLLWSAIYFPIRFAGFFSSPKGFRHAALGYVRDFIFSGSFLQLWYLPALIFSVLLVSALLKRGFPPRRIVLIALLFYLPGLLAQSWFGLIRPLASLAPRLWGILKLVQKLIYSTRDGLFDGFFFVSLGMLFAFEDVRVPKKTALTGWLLGMLLLFVESFLLERLGWAREHDMYLALIPASFFGFAWVLQTELPATPRTLQLRKLSALIFYSHELPAVFIDRCLVPRFPILVRTPLCFLLTAVGSLLLSLAVLRLSERPRFGWLRALYA